MKDRRVNPAIKRASSTLNLMPLPVPRAHWLLSSSSSLTSHSAPVKSRWLSSRFFHGIAAFYITFSLSPSLPLFLSCARALLFSSHPAFRNHKPGRNPTGRHPVYAISVSLTICPPTLAAPHIFDGDMRPFSRLDSANSCPLGRHAQIGPRTRGIPNTYFGDHRGKKGERSNKEILCLSMITPASTKNIWYFFPKTYKCLWNTLKKHSN